MMPAGRLVEGEGPVGGSMMRERSRFRKRLAHTGLFVALAVVPVLALNSLATASVTVDGGAGSRPGLTDAQRQCLSEQGVSLPTRDSGDDKPALTPEQRDARRQAAETCGLAPRPPRIALRQLTDAQRQCLADHGVTLPSRIADGARPEMGVRPEITDQERDARRQAAVDCGLPERPAGVRGGHGGGTERI